jgi:hypothetical protein
MPRDPIAEIDPIVATLSGQIKDLFLQRGLPRTPVEVHDTELALAALGRSLADQLMEVLLLASIEALQDAAQRPPAGEVIVTPRRKTRSVGRRPTTIRLLGGRQIQVRTSYRLPVRTPRPGRRRGVGRRGKAGAGYFPHLVVLGVLCGATPATLSEVARQSAESSSYEVARQNLARHGLDLDEKTRTRLTQGFGRLCLHLRQAQMLAAQEAAPDTGPLSGKRIAVSVDGGRLRIRQPRTHGRRREKTGYRGFDAPWREPKVLTVYLLDEEGRKQRHTLSLYDATLGDANAVFALLVGYLRLLGAHLATQVVLLGDGARWIWDRVDELVRAVGLVPERFVAIVDYYHAVEHLRDVTDLMGNWSSARRRRFVRYYKRVLRKGEVEEVIAAINELCVGRHAKALATERDYFAKNAERMRYQEFEEQGLPIGSGAVESAVRQVVNQRLKSNGMFWLEGHAEHMLHLRAYLRAGRWDELVRATLVHHAALGAAGTP